MSSRGQREPVAFDPSKLRRVRPREMLVRFAFGAAVSAAAALVAMRFGPVAGGLFLAFPAILPATLTLVAEKESERAARHDSRGAVAGVFGLAAFALSIRVLADRAVLALAVAMVAWVVVAVAGYIAWRSVRTAAGLEESKPTSGTGPASTESAKAAAAARTRRERASA